MTEKNEFKSLLPTYPPPPTITIGGCCDPKDYSKKFYHPNCCPNNRTSNDTCSDHDYPGHFSSVIDYPKYKNPCDRSLPYQGYHFKKTVVNTDPWASYGIPVSRSMNKLDLRYDNTVDVTHKCACGK